MNKDAYGIETEQDLMVLLPHALCLPFVGEKT